MRNKLLSLMLLAALLPLSAQETKSASLVDLAGSERLEELKQALAQGADVNGRNMYGETALHAAAEKGNADAVTLLAKSGAHIDVPDHFGWTPLMLAANGGFMTVVMFLHEQAADVNAAEEGGITALMWAAAGNHVDVLKYLIREGAEINATDQAGRTALDFVRFSTHEETIKLLRALGARAGSLTREHADVIGKLKLARGGKKATIEADNVAGAEVYIGELDEPEPVAGGVEVAKLYEEARNLYRQGQYSRMLALLLRADSKSDGKCRPCLDLMVRLHIINGDLASATTDLARLTAMAGDDARLGELNQQLGLAFFEKEPRDKRDLVLAENYLKEALARSDGADDLARFYLGRVYEEAGYPEKALDLYRTYLTNNADSPYAEGVTARIQTLEAKTGGTLGRLAIDGLDGDELDLARYRGKVVLIDIWTTWCGPCKASQPKLKRINKKYADEPFVLVGISGDQRPELVAPYVAKNDIDWAIFLDPQIEVCQRVFGARSYPTFIVLDHEGRIIWSASGWSSSVERKMGSTLAKAIREAKKENVGGR